MVRKAVITDFLLRYEVTQGPNPLAIRHHGNDSRAFHCKSKVCWLEQVREWIQKIASRLQKCATEMRMIREVKKKLMTDFGSILGSPCPQIHHKKSPPCHVWQVCQKEAFLRHKKKCLEFARPTGLFLLQYCSHTWHLGFQEVPGDFKTKSG